MPTYNESMHVKNTIKELSRFYNKEKGKRNITILFILDGCSDNTETLLLHESKQNQLPIEIIKREKNFGKGYTVKQGIMHVKTELVLVSDFDLSTPIEEFYKLEKYICHYDIVIGSRWIKTDEVKNKPDRKVLSYLSIIIINLFLNLGVRDSQCGFKLFKTKTAKKIFEKITINRFGYDFELLKIAKINNINYFEVPVIWNYKPGSKVNYKSYIKTFRELLSVWYNATFKKEIYKI
ncbi:MAG: glycosyltransferase [Candidatus Woesearchaeota archaeon]